MHIVEVNLAKLNQLLWEKENFQFKSRIEGLTNVALHINSQMLHYVLHLPKSVFIQ